MTQPECNDVYGHMLMDVHRGRGAWEVSEREDGFVSARDAAVYFGEYPDWPECEKAAMDAVTGSVLDIGCGAGKHALYLQQQGHTVTGIDTSEGAIAVCRERGLVSAEVLSAAEIGRLIESYDTFLLLGGSLSFFGPRAELVAVLTHLRGTVAPGGRLVATTRDPYQTDEPAHLAYHAANVHKGRLPGESRIRIRYKQSTTPWIDYILLSAPEFRQTLPGTGWSESKITWFDSQYLVVLDAIDH